MGDSKLEEMCMDLGQFYSSFAENREEVMAYWNVTGINFNMSAYNSGLAAYAAKIRNNPGLAQEVWDVLAVDTKRSWMEFPIKAQDVSSQEYPTEISEIKSIGTNSVSQWAINTIMSLGLIGDLLPKGFYKKNKK